MTIALMILTYYVTIQLVAYVMMGLDKRRAKKSHRHRIPEQSLWFICWLGGAVGMLLGMRIFHHKTRKPIFRFGVPCLAIIQVFILLIISDRYLLP